MLKLKQRTDPPEELEAYFKAVEALEYGEAPQDYGELAALL